MMRGISAALSALKAIGRRMESRAGNVANWQTPGYKKSRETTQEVPPAAASTAAGTAQVGRGTTLGEISTIFSQGPLVTTDSPTDLSLAGDGFFTLRLADGSTRYSRDGHFHFDARGDLVNPQGDVVQGWRLDSESGTPAGAIGDISLDSGSLREMESLSIDAGGVITGLAPDGTPRALFQIAVTDFTSPQGLSKVGHNLYQATAAAGEAVTGTPGQGGLGRITSRTLEGSNVDLVEEFSQMILNKTAYKANLKTLQQQDELMGDLLDILA